LPTNKLPLTKKTEPTKPYVMRPLPVIKILFNIIQSSMPKLENTETLLLLLPQALLITKIFYNKLKLIYNKLNTIMKKPLPLLKPEPHKEKLNIKLGLTKITKTQSKLPL
jgi:hypothetical protein